MAILSTSNLLSEQRYDVSDARRIESAVRNDFDELITGVFTNTSQPYIVRGFSIITAGQIGVPATSLEMVVDPGCILNFNASASGTVFQVPTGTPNQVLNPAINTNVTGSFAASATCYVGIDYNRFADASTNVTKYIWNSASNSEIETVAPAAQTLTFEIVISTSTWASSVAPVAIVTTGPSGEVVSISDCRWNLYALETGGLSPSPNYSYPWSAGRTQPPVTVSSANPSATPFLGGEKQLSCFKDWANAVMSTLWEIKGTSSWFSLPSSGTLPSLTSLLQDLGNTVITGSGEISNGIIPNSDPILVTTGTIVYTSNQLNSLASTAGVSDGDYIFGTGIPSGTTVVSISGSTITMSKTASLNGTAIGVTFYPPSAITSPGQINWDQPIQIRVIGSSLTYQLAANPSSTDITLSDDQVAYITFVRDVTIAPNLIFVSGSPTLVSVGAVSWTSPLQAGDYIKVASNTTSDYYQILSVDSASQVTLAANVSVADGTGSSGAQAQYAFGTYTVSASPSSNRNIYIASRESVPVGGNVFWLFMRQDNGGSPRVYVRFLSQELDNGESVEVSGTTSQELLQYIGAASAASSNPQYVSALNPNSVPQITSFTVGAGSTVGAGQYFYINSSANARTYCFWFKVSGSGSAPVLPNISNYVQVTILSSDSATAVATKLANAFNTTVYLDFAAIASSNTVTVTNTSAGTCVAASNGTVASPFAVLVSQNGTGNGNYIVQDGNNLTLAIKELDQALGGLYASIDAPSYDETVEVVASGATPPNSLNGPVANGTTITIPLNSRESNSLAQYTVGAGTLLVYLNGQFVDVESGAYTEVGTAGAPSNQIEIVSFPGGGLVVGDELQFRIVVGGGGSSGIVGPSGPAGATGPAGPAGADALNGPITISTKTSSYTVLSTDKFLKGDCTSGNLTFTLPLASVSTSKVFYFKRIDASANTIFVTAAGSDLIDGVSSIPLTVQWQSLSIVSDGTTWSIF